MALCRTLILAALLQVTLSFPMMPQEIQEMVNCPGNADGIYPHPHDMAKYIHCEDVGTENERAYIMSCPMMMVFSTCTNMCVWPHEMMDGCDDGNDDDTEDLTTTTSNPTSTTESNDEFICPGDGMFPVEDDCESFYHCVNAGTPEELKMKVACAPGLLYNQIAQLCDWSHNVPWCQDHGESIDPEPFVGTTTAEPEPTFCPDDGFYEDPTSCQFFYSCDFVGTIFESSVRLPCPNGLVFNKLDQRCDWPENVPWCSPSTSSSSTSPSTSTSFSTDQSSSAPGSESTSNSPTTASPSDTSSAEPSTTNPIPTDVFQCEENGSFPDPEGCENYYVCEFVGTGFERRTHYSCQAGLIFNERTGWCDLPMNVPSCLNSDSTTTASSSTSSSITIVETTTANGLSSSTSSPSSTAEITTTTEPPSSTSTHSRTAEISTATDSSSSTSWPASTDEITTTTDSLSSTSSPATTAETTTTTDSLSSTSSPTTTAETTTESSSATTTTTESLPSEQEMISETSTSQPDDSDIEEESVEFGTFLSSRTGRSTRSNKDSSSAKSQRTSRSSKHPSSVKSQKTPRSASSRKSR